MRINLSHVNSFLIREMIITGAIAQIVHDGGDIVYVDLPTGQLVAIHLIEREIDLPEIKRVLDYNAARQAHTLFILDAAMLLPDNNMLYRPYDWMLVLIELYNGLIYGYEVIHNRAYVFPIHFAPEPNSNRYCVTWGDMIEMAYLGATTVQTASTGFLGTWLVADFEPRHADIPRSPAPGTLAAAYAVLGLLPGVALDEIRRAYRALARQFHPDLNPAVEATRKMQEINAAYTQILSALGESADL
jgi:hypothetical protein